MNRSLTKLFLALGALGEPRWARYTFWSGVGFVLMFAITSMGFSQLPALVAWGGLLQRLTLAIFWCWTTLLALHYLKS